MVIDAIDLSFGLYALSWLVDGWIEIRHTAYTVP